MTLVRKIIKKQMQIGEVDISEIKIDLRARDEIPKLLIGLQHLYCTPELREQVFTVLDELIPPEITITPVDDK